MRHTREGFGFFSSLSHMSSKRLARLDTLSWGGSFHMSSNCSGFLEGKATASHDSNLHDSAMN